jgi:hypothetical protein
VFWRGTVTTFLDVAPRIDALSLWLHEPADARTPLAIAVLAFAYLLVWLSCRGLPHRFLLGSAAVLAAFDLMNKQSFYNQWVLVTWLLIAGAALELERRTASMTSTTWSGSGRPERGSRHHADGRMDPDPAR